MPSPASSLPFLPAPAPVLRPDSRPLTGYL